jgi:hypothetical protein
MGAVTIPGSVVIRDDLTVKGKINGKDSESETITHKTEIVNFAKSQIGTFCETNGGIYSGYKKIDTTDCICQVVTSSTLNPRIVGVITKSDEFASHGDVLLKCIAGTYSLGQILAPTASGCRVAEPEEVTYMLEHGIPRAKIISCNTGIENHVACFLL